MLVTRSRSGLWTHRELMDQNEEIIRVIVEPNYRPALDAASQSYLHWGGYSRRASEAGRSATSL